jgi:hypothetical protein
MLTEDVILGFVIDVAVTVTVAEVSKLAGAVYVTVAVLVAGIQAGLLNAPKLTGEKVQVTPWLLWS